MSDWYEQDWSTAGIASEAAKNLGFKEDLLPQVPSLPSLPNVPGLPTQATAPLSSVAQAVSQAASNLPKSAPKDAAVPSPEGGLGSLFSKARDYLSSAYSSSKPAAPAEPAKPASPFASASALTEPTSPAATPAPQAAPQAAPPPPKPAAAAPSPAVDTGFLSRLSSQDASTYAKIAAVAVGAGALAYAVVGGTPVRKGR